MNTAKFKEKFFPNSLEGNSPILNSEEIKNIITNTFNELNEIIQNIKMKQEIDNDKTYGNFPFLNYLNKENFTETVTQIYTTAAQNINTILTQPQKEIQTYKEIIVNSQKLLTELKKYVSQKN